MSEPIHDDLNEPLFNAREVSQELGFCTAPTLARHWKAGRIPAIRRGGKIGMTRRMIDAWNNDPKGTREREGVVWGELRGTIYVVQWADHAAGPVKIGFTAGDSVARRLCTLQTASPYRLIVVAAFPGTYPEEKALHRRFAAARLEGEWFKATDEVLSWIATLRKDHT